jgi:dipeptidyl aminopeptidase/acylaminoacyl peptidase
LDLDDPDVAYVGTLYQNVMSVNVHTAESHYVQDGVGTFDWFTSSWYMDGHGHVIARVDKSLNYYKKRVKTFDGHDWHDLGEFETGDGLGPVGLTEDGASVAVEERNDQTFAVLVAHAISDPSQRKELFSNPNFDIDYIIKDEWTDRVIGVAYADDRMEYVYFDPKREALQRRLQQVFPHVSVHAVSSDLAQDKVIVATEAPRQPTKYYLLDRTTHIAEPLQSAYPNLTEADLGEMKPYPYRARDGLDIPAYLTLPPGKQAHNLPLVVMPHGGPEVRDMLAFDWMGQFFANRGYAVFQPNYRGSSGYGHKFTEAGLMQWGLKMQDDITDGVRKLIADGIVDPKRICIVGGSYGGYAALAGAAFTLDLYACAVSFAAVTDLPSFIHTVHFDRGSGAEALLVSRIGSPIDDSEQLRATSPARHAEAIKCPVLLMHGEGDTTVRIDQSERMYDALREAGKKVQFIRFPGEDHYFGLASTRIQFLSETEKFLAANIGERPVAANN